MTKIADWVVENEKKASTDCKLPDEVIDEWIETIEERKQKMQENGNTHTGHFEMLQDLNKKVKEIQAIRKTKCHTKTI